MEGVEVREQQRERLRKTIDWAQRVRAELQPLLEAHSDRIHFRPSSTGIAMVGLLPARPQRGKSGITNLKSIREGFEALFDANCRNVAHGRVTGEKALQSHLISEAQTNGRRLVSINRASTATEAPVELQFITDEISLPMESGKIVCDILALRRDGGRCTPVLLELKDRRQLTRLVEQVEGYAKLIDDHADLFAVLFGALLGEDITFDGPTEKWIIWPAAGAGPDPRTQELRERGIRVVGYANETDGYSFIVGPGVAAAASIGSSAAVTRIATTNDPRITNLCRLGTGEGFGTYSGDFQGKPAFIVDCGTMDDLLNDEDRSTDNVTVRVFESGAARDGYVDELRLKSPAALGGSALAEGFSKSEISKTARVRGCLLGGAVGDALGAPVEFMQLDEIRRSFGATGIEELAPAYGRVGAITDDTQMTLFTAEGLIRAQVRYAGRGICHPPGVIHHALLRWLLTQGDTSPAFPKSDKPWPDGWLVHRKELHSRRAPGMTCLSALKASKQFGDEASNDSKGCGAIMRIAPIGLFVRLDEASDGSGPRPFAMACESARSTHGHATSTLASGFFALVIAHLLRGTTLTEAIGSSRRWVERGEASEEVVAAIDNAVALASSEASSSPDTIERLGGGWIAEEALAISLFCALRAQSFEHGIRLAVNHSGDSDSTGSMTGQLLGTLWGVDAIPQRWVDQVELRDIIEELARDLVGVAEGDWESYWDRYPGW